MFLFSVSLAHTDRDRRAATVVLASIIRLGSARRGPCRAELSSPHLAPSPRIVIFDPHPTTAQHRTAQHSTAPHRTSPKANERREMLVVACRLSLVACRRRSIIP
eukprot:jgi/Psemu1/316748/fgenesh1_kg.3977_\